MKLDCCLYSGNDGACLIGKHSTGVFGASLLAVPWAWGGCWEASAAVLGGWQQWTKAMAVQVDGRSNPGSSQHQTIKIWVRVQDVSG